MKKTKKTKKILAIVLVMLVFISSVRFLIFKPKYVLADSTLGFNEGYGTTVNDNNSNITGTITNAVWKQEDLCRVKKCLYFDGTGDYVSFSDNSNLDFGASNSFTLEGWFRTPDISSGQRTIIAKHNATAGGYKIYMDSNGYLIFGIDDDSTWTPDDSVTTSTTAFDDNRWHFFSGVKTETSISIYVDGKLYQTDSSLVATGSLVNSNSFYVGIDGDGSSNGFSGFLDEIKIIKSGKSASEIMTDYSGGSNSLSGAAPVGWWKLDENTSTSAYDSSGNENTGTLTNGPTWGTGKYSNSVVFDGTDDNITITRQSSIQNITNNGTISAWIKPSAVDTSLRTLFDLSSSGVNGIILFSNDTSGLINFQYGTGASTVNLTSSSTPSVNNWYFVTATWDSRGGKLYINGALDNSNQTAPSIAVGAGTSYIGTQGAFPTRTNKGTIDDLRIYDYARSQSQILEDMQGFPPTGVTASFGPDDSWISNGLVGYWKMDETSWTNNCSTDSALDSSGNGNNLDSCPNASGPTGGATGKFGYAGDFVASTGNDGDRISGSPVNISSTVGSQMTISTWLKPDATQTNSSAVYIRNGTGYDENYELYLSNLSGGYYRLRFQYYDGTDFQDIGTTNLIIPASSWSHVAVIINQGQNINAYLNGTFIETIAWVGNPAVQATSSLNIGGNTSSGLSYDGVIDEARIYNRALSPAEVAKLYNWAPGPIGYWPFDENTGITTAYDISGNGNNATFGEGASETAITYNPWVQGKFGSAARFTGGDSGSVAVIGTPTTLKDLPQLSISAWVKSINSSSSNDRIIDHQSSNTAGWNLYITSAEELSFIVDYDGASNLVVESPTITNLQNTWHHVTATWDGTANASGVKLYIDGVETLPYSTATNGVGNRVAEGASSSLGIGRRVNSNQSGFYGTIDDVKIYGYQRTQSQLIEDMNGGHPAPGSPIGSSVAYWKFDEGYGTTAYDNSINANNLTLSTASWTNSGKFGKAFNGLTNVRLSRTTDPDLEFSATEDFTISLWYKSDSANNPAAIEYLVNDGAAAGSAGYAIYANTDGTICFGIDDDTSWGPDVASCTPTDVYDNTWHHITAVRNVTLDTTKIYLDAVEKDSDTDSTTATLDSSPTFYIGDANATDGTDEFLGDIDEVKIFRSALTSDTIKVLYNQSSGQSLGSLSTDSSNNPSNSDERSYCPPGDTTATCSPVGEWKLDENTGTAANDSTDNNNTGTLTNDPTWTVGKFGSAVSFDGSNDYVQIANNSSYKPTVQITISGWAYHPSDSTKTSLVITGSNSQLKLFGSGPNSSTLYPSFQLTLTSAGNINCQPTTATIPLGSWSHLTGTYDGQTMKVFLNGILTGSCNYTDTISHDSNPLWIGSVNTGSSFTYGKIDNVKIYNYARTPAQIAWDMNRGGPVAHWKMDENTGTTANDSSGFGNTGTLTNTPTWTTGKFNYATSFAGSNQHITKSDPTNGSLDFVASEPFTISTWFKHNTASATETLITKMVTSDNDGGYKLKMESDGDITCETDDDDADTTIDDTATTTAANYDDNAWHHVACVYDITNTDLYIYIDGVLAATDSSTTTNSLANDDALFIGIDSATGTEDWIGQIDDTRIYRYPLTIQQIKTVMNNGSAVKF